MATKSVDQAAPKIEEDPLSQALVPEGEVPGGFTVFTGFAGRVGRNGMLRLYLTEGLDEYVEIASSDIKFSDVVLPPAVPRRLTKVWVAEGVDVKHVLVRKHTAKADAIQRNIDAERYLSGPIAQAMTAEAVGIQTGAPLAFYRSHIWCCFTCYDTKKGTHCCHKKVFDDEVAF